MLRRIALVFILALVAVASANAQTGCRRPYTYPSPTDWISCSDIMIVDAPDGNAYFVDYEHFNCYSGGQCEQGMWFQNVATNAFTTLTIVSTTYTPLPIADCRAGITGFRVVFCWDVKVVYSGAFNGTFEFSFEGEHNPYHYPQVIFANAENPSNTFN